MSDTADDPVWSLLVSCMLMFVASFASGYIPLRLKLKPAHAKLVTTLGAGLLVGTALVVIIPEGIHQVYTSSARHTVSVSPIQDSDHLLDDDDDDDDDTSVAGRALFDDHDHSAGELGDCLHANGQHGSIGAALAAGFVLMLLVDRFWDESPGHGHSHGNHDHNHLRGGSGQDDVDAVDPETASLLVASDSSLSASSDEFSPQSQAAPPGLQPVTSAASKSSSATIGLLVHCAVDGVAMGAVAQESSTQLSFIVFVALMLHKAPAAFGLVSFLLHEDRSESEIIRLLTYFSAAAPVTALGTFVLLAGGDRIEWVGLAMLFSAGTFLYVACVHILPEVKDDRHGRMPWSQVWLLCLGVLLPCFVSIDHQH